MEKTVDVVLPDQTNFVRGNYRYGVRGVESLYDDWGLLASLPLISYLGMIWLFADTRDTTKVADLSMSIFWLVLPSLALFVALPFLTKEWPFVPSLLTATLIMFVGYGLRIVVLRRFGMSI